MDFAPYLPILAGAGAGGVLAWVLALQRNALALSRLAAETDADFASALRNQETDLAEAKALASRIPELQAMIKLRDETVSELNAKLASSSASLAAVRTELQKEREAAAEKIGLLNEAQQKLANTFQALSAEALNRNNASFLELAKTSLERFQESAKGDLEKRQIAIHELVKPVRESLEKVDNKIQEIEKSRTGAYEALSHQVRAMMEAQTQLRTETHHLVQALKSPVVRGRWGEVQLRRVVEMAGMVDHCDFEEQSSVNTEQGNRLRPDLVVRLPGGKQIVVDAKAPLSAYLEAMEARDDNTRLEKLTAHASLIRAHIEALTKKAYWEQFEPAPEFVVLFLPGESFFSAALERDPTLIEYGTERMVILATPTTLISLLKAVFYGWRQQALTKNAEEISRLGRELYKRISDMGGHMERLGRSLNNAVEHFNKLAANTEARVLVTARKFRDLEPSQNGNEIEVATQIEVTARHLNAPELAAGSASAEPLNEVAKVALEAPAAFADAIQVQAQAGEEPVDGEENLAENASASAEASEAIEPGTAATAVDSNEESVVAEAEHSDDGSRLSTAASVELEVEASVAPQNDRSFEALDAEPIDAIKEIPVAARPIADPEPSEAPEAEAATAKRAAEPELAPTAVISAPAAKNRGKKGQSAQQETLLW